MNSLNILFFIIIIILISVLLTITLILLSRTNHSLKGEYDERQQPNMRLIFVSSAAAKATMISILFGKTR